MTEENAMNWLASSGGWYDETAMGLQEYPGMGLGAVALRDIEVRPPSLPFRSYLTLSNASRKNLCFSLYPPSYCYQRNIRTFELTYRVPTGRNSSISEAGRR
jgi:hypothetical protein